MMNISVNWSFKRKNIIPIVEVKGECKENAVETYMIKKAVKIIEQASEFKGKLYQTEPSPSKNFSITVSFSLIFPSDKELTNFMKSIQQGK